jgi:hypothetical protein
LIGDDFDELSSLCVHSIKDQNLKQKSHLADLALCYIDFLKLKIKMSEESLSMDQLCAIAKISNQLSEVTVTFKD